METKWWAFYDWWARTLYDWDLNYNVARFIYIFSAMFFFPVGIYNLVNPHLVDFAVQLALLAGWGLGWVWQDMHRPSPKSRPGEDSYVDHLFF